MKIIDAEYGKKLIESWRLDVQCTKYKDDGSICYAKLELDCNDIYIITSEYLPDEFAFKCPVCGKYNYIKDNMLDDFIKVYLYNNKRFIKEEECNYGK